MKIIKKYKGHEYYINKSPDGRTTVGFNVRFDEVSVVVGDVPAVGNFEDIARSCELSIDEFIGGLAVFKKKSNEAVLKSALYGYSYEEISKGS